jgi:subtilisin family serine protease
MSNTIKMSVIAASVCGALSMSATNAFEHEHNNFAKSKHHKISQAQEQNYYIVRLESGSLVNVDGALDHSRSGNKFNVNAQSVQSHKQALAEERTAFASVMAQAIPSAKVDRFFDSTMNAVVVKSPKDIYSKLKSLPGVTKVFKEERYFPEMDTSLSLINAPQAWEKLGGDREAGKGVRVAVIDTGIVPTNPMFDDAGMAAPTDALPTDDYCRTVDASFCNNKLIVARYSVPTFEQPDTQTFSPLDVGGHGTHVAGTAVGSKISTDYNNNAIEISGVAPGAYLMAYKALYTGGGSNIMLIEALEHALEDGADVINNSWGGGYGTHPANSAYAEVFKNIEDAGVVAVVSAGNGGAGPQTIGGPANLDTVISVANTDHGRVFTTGMKLGDSDYILHKSSSTTAFDTVISAKPILAGVVDPENIEGCSAFPANSLDGGFAVVSRGSCNFSQKATNAADAGAKALLVYNNRGGSPFSMYMGEVNALPSFMVSQADGEMITEAASVEGFDSEISVDGVARVIQSEVARDSVTSSSSRGPNGDPSILKPNIAAPGTNTLSAYLNKADGSAGFAELTGTSMSGPHVAGAAALLKQQYPTWSAKEIKSALANTSVTEGLKKTDQATPVDAFDVGAGRLDVKHALDAQITFAEMGLSETQCIESCDYSVSIRNMTSEPMNLTLKAVSMGSGASIDLNNRNLELAAHGEDGDAKVASVTMNIKAVDLDAWQFARIEAYSDSGDRLGHLPLAAFAASTSLPGLAVSTSGVSDTDAFDVNLGFTNETIDGTVTIASVLPQSLTMVPDSFDVTLEGGEKILATADMNANHVGFTGSLNKALMTSSAAEGLAVDLKADDEYSPPCQDSCDDSDFKFNLANLGNGFTFKLAGKEYDYITITTNGLIIAGNGSASGTGANSEIPSSNGQNGLIAPLWADFDLQGDDETSGGNVYVAVKTVGEGDDAKVYWVTEWADAELYEDTSNDKFTFQSWIRLNGEEEIFFNYIKVPRMPDNATIGIENANGLVGYQVYYNGKGTAPVEGKSTHFAYVPGGSLGMSFKAKFAADAEIKAGVEDSITMSEDTSSEAIDVLANDTAQHVDLIPLKLTNRDGLHQRAVQSLTFTTPEAGFDATTLAIVSAPKNGSVEFTDGKAVYTPNANFYGNDSFTYTAKVAGESNHTLAPTKVNVTVTDVAEPVTPTPPVTLPESNSSSSGSLAWLALLAAPFAALRRRKQK